MFAFRPSFRPTRLINKRWMNERWMNTNVRTHLDDLDLYNMGKVLTGMVIGGGAFVWYKLTDERINNLSERNEQIESEIKAIKELATQNMAAQTAKTQNVATQLTDQIVEQECPRYTR